MRLLLLPSLIGIAMFYFMTSKGTNASHTQEGVELTPTKVVQLYYELSLKGKFDKANQLITNTNGIVASPEAYDTKTTKLIFDGKIEIRKIICESIKNKNAQVVTEVSDNAGHIYQLEHELYKDHESWKIWVIGVHSKNMEPCK
jgi:hypothetical protein